MTRIIEIPPTDTSALTAIGRLRYDVWAAEGAIAAERFPSGIWLDAFDASARHWGAFDAGGRLVAAARLTLHRALADAPDGYVWLDAGRSVPEPLGNISKLVVTRAARGCGLGRALTEVRIAAARAAGARTLTVTSSFANARTLRRLGFADDGLRVEFPDRPAVPFLALTLAL
jgi:GNAT superfamily N-acetyltransferase